MKGTRATKQKLEHAKDNPAPNLPPTKAAARGRAFFFPTNTNLERYVLNPITHWPPQVPPSTQCSF